MLNPGRYLPESGVIPDGPDSANVCGTGSGEPSPRCTGVLSERDMWNAIENEHEGPPCQYDLGYDYVIAMKICKREMRYLGRGWMY